MKIICKNWHRRLRLTSTVSKQAYLLCKTVICPLQVSSVHPILNRSILLFFMPVLLTVLFLNLTVTSLHAQTEVEGDVYGVWDVEGSPYLVVDTLTIPEDSTLTIEPGVTVEFQDQNETRFPFYVHGTLEAVGEEGDSIYFTSPDSAFQGFISPNDYRNTLIRLEYCVIDSAVEAFDTQYGNSIILLHSNIYAVDEFMYCSYHDSVTIQFSSFITVNDVDQNSQPIRISYTDYVLFQNNYGPGARLRIVVGSEVSTIMNNQLSSVFLDDIELETEIFNNILNGMTCSSGTYHVHHNRSSGELGNGLINCIEGDNVEIEYNSFGRLYFSDGSGIIHDNEFINDLTGPDHETISLSHSEVSMYKNLIVSLGTAIDATSVSENSQYIGNTIIFSDNGIDNLYAGNYVVNNIFIGDGVNCPAIDAGHDPGLIENVRYNVFNNVSEVLRYGDEDDLDTTNIYTNPRLNGGEPFDYHLQPNSPCIDAGDPDSPDDPDNTQADIGVYFYDQGIDNPPALISPTLLTEQSGTEFSYIALAIDDEGPLTFHFENLPDWLEEEENNLAWVADSAVIFGTIPDEIDEFEFIVWVEDGLGHADTANVFCEVIHYNLLRGEISGVLSQEDSPFLLVDDVIVPAADTLIIEPGCRLNFRYVEHEDFRIQMKVFGTLLSEGTEEDSIVYSMLDEEVVDKGWNGVWIIDSQDTSRISYSDFKYSIASIYGDSGLVSINNSRFRNTERCHAIWANEYSRFTVSQCTFYGDSDGHYTHIGGINSSIIINRNTFICDPPNTRAWAISGYASDFEIIDNIFNHVSYLNVNFGSTATLRGNYFLECPQINAVTTGNQSSLSMFNNFFLGSQDTLDFGYYCYSVTDSIINNIFMNYNVGIWLNDVEENFTDFPLIRNNVFMDCNIPILNELIGEYEGYIQYNCFWNNDSLNRNLEPDSTNLSVNPSFTDTLFRLFANSLLINAGDPDSAYNDVDGSRNDIGSWGGPGGQSYDYPTWVCEDQTQIPNEFHLFTPYPNPFNHTQTVYFSLPHSDDIILTLYNLLGQKALTQYYPSLQAGKHVYTLDASSLSSGIYILELSTREEKQSTKVILLK